MRMLWMGFVTALGFMFAPPVLALPRVDLSAGESIRADVHLAKGHKHKGKWKEVRCKYELKRDRKGYKEKYKCK